jgi:hypothetical protein
MMINSWIIKFYDTDSAAAMATDFCYCKFAEMLSLYICMPTEVSHQ